MIANVILILILTAIVLVAVGQIKKHLRGESPCCGGGGSPVKLEKKQLEGPKLGEKTLAVTGMTCENCAIRVTNAINRLEGASAKVDYKKGRAVVSYDRLLSEQELRRAVESQGYHVTAVS